MKKINKIVPHLLVLIGFVLVSIIYFYPVLQGNKIFQSDIVQYTGMAKEQNDFRTESNEEPYWTNSAFGGMPTYQLGAKYPNDFIGEIDNALRLVPRAGATQFLYLFIYDLLFLTLFLFMKVERKFAFWAAFIFSFILI